MQKKQQPELHLKTFQEFAETPDEDELAFCTLSGKPACTIPYNINVHLSFLPGPSKHKPPLSTTVLVSLDKEV